MLLSVLDNVGIALGYMLIALTLVVPTVNLLKKLLQPGHRFAVWNARIGAILFFSTCGLHHLENAFHVVFYPHEGTEEMMTAPHMLVIDTVQIVSVYMMIFGVLFGIVAPLIGMNIVVSLPPKKEGSDDSEHQQD